MTTALDVLIALCRADARPALLGASIRYARMDASLPPDLLALARTHQARLVALLGGPSLSTGRAWSVPCGPAFGWAPSCPRCLDLAQQTGRAVACGDHAAPARRSGRSRKAA